MELEPFKARLRRTARIVFSEHALLRAEERKIDLKEIEQNIRDPERLIHVREEDERFTCWFAYSGSLGHRYTIHINADTLIITVIKIRPRWQREVEKHAQKIPRRLRC